MLPLVWSPFALARCYIFDFDGPHLRIFEIRIFEFQIFEFAVPHLRICATHLFRLLLFVTLVTMCRPYLNLQ